MDELLLQIRLKCLEMARDHAKILGESHDTEFIASQMNSFYDLVVNGLKGKPGRPKSDK